MERIASIADFAPAEVESGVGLLVHADDGRFLCLLAGSRELCPPGEVFYAGIGGHREPGEEWLACAHREAREEVGSDVDVLDAPSTWHVTDQGAIERLELSDRPRPLMLYEMIHPPRTPRAGQVYRLVIYMARLLESPRNLPPDEVAGLMALTREQMALGLARQPCIADLLDEGATLVAGEALDRRVRLYPLGTARAYALLLAHAPHDLLIP
jgi:8-oxo-dGTP pyrophosphatase MutT (NUDIX family)